MDWTQIATFAATMLTMLLVEGGKAFADEAGKGLAHKSAELYKTIRNKLAGDRQSEQILDRFVQNPQTQQADLVKMLMQKAATDAAFAREVKRIVRNTRNVLLDCLEKSFTDESLDALIFRMGFREGQLTGAQATNIKKVINLVEAIETQERIPELIETMWKVNPDLRC